MTLELFFETRLEPARPLQMGEGPAMEEPVFVRRSRLNPGHISLISPHRLQRELPNTAHSMAEEETDNRVCRFCHPDTLCAESPEERTKLDAGGREFILARTPYYYFHDQAILFPGQGPHRLADATEQDWRLLLQAGCQVARSEPYIRLGFNAGTYLCSGGSQRHLHLQLVPMQSPAPAEEALDRSVGEGASFRQLRHAFHAKGLILEEAPRKTAFLAASWAPRFNLELVAVFSGPRRFSEMQSHHLAALSSWIHGISTRFIIPQGGGINGFGLETRQLPFMVRIIPRLPGAVQAFMETGAGCMVISCLPEKISSLWRSLP